jgi:hypothetical protein
MQEKGIGRRHGRRGLCTDKRRDMDPGAVIAPQ